MEESTRRGTRTGSRGEPLPAHHNDLPDSTTLNGLCPRCGTHSSFAVSHQKFGVTVAQRLAPDRPGNRTSVLDQAVLLVCEHCKQGTVVIEEERYGSVPARLATDEERLMAEAAFRGIHWWPLPDTQLSPDIPRAVADDYAEAMRCLYADAPRAAVAMFRRSVESLCNDKGATTGRLVDKIRKLASDSVLPPVLAEWATEVRQMGNSGAHPISDTPISMDDAKQLQAFARELLRHAYELPAELARRRGTSLPSTQSD